MANHTKPTKAELEQKIKDAQAKIDALHASPSPSAAPSPSKAVPSASPSPSQQQPSVSPSASPSPSKEQGKPSPSPSPSEEDEVKKKSKASAIEAQVLLSRTKKYDDAVSKADEIKEPEDEIMIKEYGQDVWDKMDAVTRVLAKKNWVNEQKFTVISQAAKEGKDAQAWIQNVDDFVTDPKVLIKHPELEGRTDDFKLFALPPSRRGLDFEELLLMFKGYIADHPQKKNKGKMFELGSAGARNKETKNDGKMSVAQAAVLRKTDYKAWKLALKQGKIRPE